MVGVAGVSCRTKRNLSYKVYVDIVRINIQKATQRAPADQGGQLGIGPKRESSRNEHQFIYVN